MTDHTTEYPTTPERWQDGVARVVAGSPRRLDERLDEIEARVRRLETGDGTVLARLYATAAQYVRTTQPVVMDHDWAGSARHSREQAAHAVGVTRQRLTALADLCEVLGAIDTLTVPHDRP